MKIQLFLIGIISIIATFVHKYRNPEKIPDKWFIFSLLLGITLIIIAFYF